MDPVVLQLHGPGGALGMGLQPPSHGQGSCRQGCPPSPSWQGVVGELEQDEDAPGAEYSFGAGAPRRAGLG